MIPAPLRAPPTGITDAGYKVRRGVFVSEELWEPARLGSARREAGSGASAAFQCMFAAGTAAATEKENATAFS